MTEALHFTHTECERADPFHYTACGLDNVYLMSGYNVETFGGEQYVSVKDAEELHEAIAVFLVNGKKVLEGQEVRFLRKFLGLTQASLGQALGVSDQAVARYEKDKTKFDGSSDILLRLYVKGKIEGDIDVAAEVESLRQNDGVSADDLCLQHEGDEWRVSPFAKAA